MIRRLPLFIPVLLLFSLGLGGVTPVLAAPAKGAGNSKVNPTSLKPEVLGAKAFLEELLVRRYSQELATHVERSFFTLGAELQLSEIPPAPPPVNTPPVVDETPADLMLGTISPDELIKKYASDTEGAIKVSGFLKDFRIKGVSVSVGLKDELPPEVKAETEKWLNARIAGEFGKIGKGAVTLIKAPPEKKVPPKNPWERLEQFQQLAGQIILALALLLGAILWALLQKPSKEKSTGDLPSASAPAPIPAPPAPVKAEGEMTALEKKAQLEELHASQEVAELSLKLSDLSPRLAGQYDRVIRSWCQAGEEGRLKLACFTEAVGKEIGKLPIPVDALGELTKVFSEMPNLKIGEKRDALKKVYWDILRALNLGTESFEQPFDYLGGFNLNLISQVLIDQNPKMKALVTLYMPPKLREQYLKSQTREAKLTILKSAADLSEIETGELATFDASVKGKLKPGAGKSVVALDQSLSKVIAALSPLEELQLLNSLSAESPRSFDSYKRSTPSLAFIHEWNAEKLTRFLSRCMPDEVVAYLRVVPKMADHFVSLCPPMTAELVRDELSRNDGLKDADKNRLLTQLSLRLKEMVTRGEANLDDVFPAASATPVGGHLKNVA